MALNTRDLSTRDLLAELGFTLVPGEHPIVPVMLYEAPLAHFDVAPNGTLVYLSSGGGEYVGEQLAWVTREGDVEVIEGLFQGGGDPAAEAGCNGSHVH